MTSTELLKAKPRRLVAALGLAAIVGCGGGTDGFAHYPVEGSVTLDGQPLKSGNIMFIAQEKGASSTAEIAEGAFRLSGADGLSPGPYRVEVYSVQPTGKKVPSSDDPKELVDETANLVPKSYNVQSSLKADIPADGPKAPLSFALSGAAGKPGGKAGKR